MLSRLPEGSDGLSIGKFLRRVDRARGVLKSLGLFFVFAERDSVISCVVIRRAKLKGVAAAS